VTSTRSGMTDESFEEIFCFHPIEKMFLNFQSA
jgi:hypothetical protein